MDDKNQRSAAQRNQEPKFVDVTTSGTHAAGNYLQNNREISAADKVERITEDGLVWIDQEDHAKQGMARKGDAAHAEASPDHPHTGPAQSGRQ